MTRHVHPPRLAEWLLWHCLPRGGVRASVLGDLHELYTEKATDPKLGAHQAARWYWEHALRISLRYLIRRVRPGRLVPFDGGPTPDANAMGDVMGEFIRDVRFTLRGFARKPGFLVMALVTLALGVGANTAVFSVVNGVYLRPLDFQDPDRLVQVGQSALDRSWSMEPHTAGTWTDWAANSTCRRSR